MSTAGEPTDERLLQQVAEGSQRAFTLLFRRRRSELYRFALHLTGSPAVAEDATQEAFMIVMREARRYEATRATAIAWLCGITRNCVRRRLDRDRFLHPVGNADDVDRTARPVAPPDVLDEIARAERLDQLRRALMSLPLRYREAVVLCDLQELNYVDAAAALGCAVGTVRSRLHRGRALLAAKLRASHDRPGFKLRKTGCFA